MASTATETPPFPLAGVRVLDMARVLSGPLAGRMMRDLGADVVKVEPPERDVTRYWGKVVANLPGYFFAINAGKRDISIDLRKPEGVALARDLAAKADVLIENFRPGVMDRLGLGYETLKAINPRLVMLSISGFGQGGPESHRPAYAPAIQAELGIVDRGARRSGLPHQDLPTSIADTNAALHGLVAILAALHLRARTGIGQHIDLSMMDATAFTDDQLIYEIEEAEHTMGLPPDIWETQMGAVLVSTDFRQLFRLLQQHAGLADPATPDMDLPAKIAARRAAVAALMAGLDNWEAVDTLMHRINVAWGQVRRGHDLLDQPTLKHRGVFEPVDDRAGGTRPVARAPYRFSAAASRVQGPAPHHGEHNAEVLADWLGRPAQDAAALEAAGVLLADDSPMR